MTLSTSESRPRLERLMHDKHRVLRTAREQGASIDPRRNRLSSRFESEGIFTSP